MAKLTKSYTKAIEKKFGETAFRLSQERSDFLLPQILDFVRNKKWLNLRPEYQRRLVWDDSKRSRFIESLLLNVPIPPVFLYEWDLSRYEVMDGQQRLNSIVDFYKNAFALKGLEKWEELNSLLHKDLPVTLRRGSAPPVCRRAPGRRHWHGCSAAGRHSQACFREIEYWWSATKSSRTAQLPVGREIQRPSDFLVPVSAIYRDLGNSLVRSEY